VCLCFVIFERERERVKKRALSLEKKRYAFEQKFYPSRRLKKPKFTT
jgi:hypothetical protein